MNRKLVMVAIVLTATVLFSFGRARAQASFPVSLAAPPGSWAGQGNATFTVCYNADFSDFADCASAGNTEFVSLVEVAQQTIAPNGNGCAAITTTQSAESAYPPFPAHVFNVIQTSQNTSFNVATGLGAATTTNYPAGPGTYCNGAMLVNTAGAVPEGTGIVTFVVSQKGNRSDAVLLTKVSEPVDYVDNYVGSGFLNRQ